MEYELSEDWPLGLERDDKPFYVFSTFQSKFKSYLSDVSRCTPQKLTFVHDLRTISVDFSDSWGEIHDG